MPLLFSDFLCFDISLLFLTVTLRGVSNKHCILPFFHFAIVFEQSVGLSKNWTEICE